VFTLLEMAAPPYTAADGPFFITQQTELLEKLLPVVDRMLESVDKSKLAFTDKELSEWNQAWLDSCLKHGKTEAQAELTYTYDYPHPPIDATGIAWPRKMLLWQRRLPWEEACSTFAATYEAYHLSKANKQPKPSNCKR
jgi:hypothetical protein